MMMMMMAICDFLFSSFCFFWQIEVANENKELLLVIIVFFLHVHGQ